MVMPEPDPRNYDAVDASSGFDGRDRADRTTHPHPGATLDQPSSGRLSDSASLWPIRATEPSENELAGVEAWPRLAPYPHSQTAVHSLRILIVATEAPPVHGGIAREVGYLREGLQARGHHVDVLAYPEVRRLVIGEIRLSGLVARLPQLFRRIKEYDVIHIHGATPTISDFVLLLARVNARLPGPHPLMIYTHHMDLDFGHGGFLTKAYNHLHHRLSARADAVIASTGDNLRLVGNGGRGLVIPWGIDVDHFSTRGQKDARFTVLFVGQFRPYKGVRVLLQAMSQVRGARLLVAGEGLEEHAYRAQGAELGLDVEFHIAVDDDQLRQLYQRTHAVVLPSVSRAESFGLVLVEGMAAGCVPIASDLPGVREVVGQSGLLFPAGSAIHLAEILCGLRDNPALVQRMAERARARAASFSRERTIHDYEHLITGLIASRDLRNRLADLAASMDASSLIAPQDLKCRLADQAESCASALHIFAMNAIHTTWDAEPDRESGAPDAT